MKGLKVLARHIIIVSLRAHRGLNKVPYDNGHNHPECNPQKVLGHQSVTRCNPISRYTMHYCNVHTQGHNTSVTRFLPRSYVPTNTT